MSGYKMVTKVCVVCQKEYECYFHDKETQKYCSHKCYGETLRTPIDKNDLYKLYYIDNLTTKKIGELLGVSKTSISRAMKRYGFKPYTTSQKKVGKGFKKPSKEELERLYLDLWLSYETIGNIFNVTRYLVHLWMKEYDIPARENYETRNGPDFVYPTKDELIEYYEEQKMGTREVAQIFKCNPSMIQSLLKQYNIPARSNIFNGKSFLICKDGHRVRSGYERCFDDELHFLGIDHEYESRLPFDKRYACDFKVKDVYIEIWGVQNNKKYEERRKRKIALYNENNAKLLSVYPEDFKNLEHKLEELKHLVK